jgi:hypothetical protein
MRETFHGRGTAGEGNLLLLLFFLGLGINRQRRWIDLEKTLNKSEFSHKERSSKRKGMRKT